jgi:fructose-1,6-bisphosphatase I
MACKTISTLVNRAGISALTGYEAADDYGKKGKGGNRGKINVQGEAVKKLDVLSNDVLKNALRFTGKLGVLASEEVRRQR